MTRKCEYKKHYNPEIGRYVKTHVHGEGVSDVLKAITGKIFSNTVKKTLKAGVQKGAEKAFENAATKAGDFAAKKAGDKIVQLLSRNNIETPLITQPPLTQSLPTQSSPLTDYEINERVNQLLSGGKLRKMKIM